jgi:hypothetical protein
VSVSSFCERCAKKLRSDNTTGYCTQHRHLSDKLKAQARGRYVSTAPDPLAIIQEAQLRADSRGHNVYVEPDVEPDTYVGKCTRCAQFLAVDLSEEPEAYGKAATSVCAGAPARAPAVRRSVFTLDVAHTSGSNEYADGIMVGRLEPQWDDPEGSVNSRRKQS